MSLRQKLYMVFFLFSFLVVTGNTVSWASGYNIEIRQINPDGWTYTGSCDDSAKELCHVFMGVKPQGGYYETDSLELDVGIALKEGYAYFQFKSG